MNALSDSDCPEGSVCEQGQCIGPAEYVEFEIQLDKYNTVVEYPVGRQIGPGIYEYLNQGTVYEYKPPEVHVDIIEPELTEEEIERCERLGREFGYDEESIKRLKNTTRQLKGSQIVVTSDLDAIMEDIEKLWFDRVPKDKERSVQLYTTEEGLKRFNEAVKKEFNKKVN